MFYKHFSVMPCNKSSDLLAKAKLLITELMQSSLMTPSFVNFQFLCDMNMQEALFSLNVIF